MSSNVQLVLVNYEMMKKFANSFRGQEAAVQQTTQKLTKVIEQLRGGDWIGEGATQFFNEMDSDVLPAERHDRGRQGHEGDREDPARYRILDRVPLQRHPKQVCGRIIQSQTRLVDRASRREPCLRKSE
jgi:hypothetical protein